MPRLRSSNPGSPRAGPGARGRADMRALLSTAPGGPETLELSEVADPVAAGGQVVIAVRACAINYPDVLVIEDKYQFRPERPFAPGGEIAGVIEHVGAGVEGWQAADRVIAMIGNGGPAADVPAAAARPGRKAGVGGEGV